MSAPSPPSAALRFQERMLEGVSRTFALTIPALPADLREVVGNGYLLCRIADTLEDDRGLDTSDRRALLSRLAAVVAGETDPESFAAEASARLTEASTRAERELVRNAPLVLEVTRSFSARERAALVRCVGAMCAGMPRFGGRDRPGLDDLRELRAYCHVVAGVVGEMLTELFCARSPRMAGRRQDLHRLSASFGQGLQLTNILKDLWEDLERGSCWLPRDVCERAGLDLGRLAPGAQREPLARCLETLVGVAHAHLRDALLYTLLVPKEEVGIRRFCAWALGMAVLTLRRIHGRPGFRSAREVKIPRATVRATLWVSDLALRSDTALRSLFALCSRGLPLAPAGARFAQSP